MPRTYYPGFFGALFLVLLRVAIGWHFLYEGCAKVESTARGSEPFASARKPEKAFSAEDYLRHSTGPLARYFRGMVPDVNGLDRLRLDRLQKHWTDEVERLARYYGFDQNQRADADAILKKSLADAKIWFEDQEFQEKRDKYLQELAAVQRVEQDPHAMAFQRERAAAGRRGLDVDRKELLKDIDAIGGALREAVVKLATPEQAKAARMRTRLESTVKELAAPQQTESDRPSEPMTTLDWVNLATMYGLIVMGFCLVAGLFTRLSALAGVVFLVQIYLCMPPWPWLAANPQAPGHYLFVNQVLIEALACLALVFLPTGHWIGFDALLFGRRRRRRLQRALERQEAEHDRDHERRTHTASRPRSL